MIQNSNQRPIRAFTLVELMVAIAVISLLAGIALPRVKEAIEGQKLSRAASLVQAAIQEGRARAIADGGGGGIIIDRIGTGNIADRSESIQMRFATVSPAYTGDAAGAKVRIGLEGHLTPAINDDRLVLWFDPTNAQARRSVQDRLNDPTQPTLINIGDYVQIGDGGLNVVVDSMGFGSTGRWLASGPIARMGNVPAAQIAQWVWMEVTHEEPMRDFTRFIGLDKSFVITRTPRPAISLPVELPRGTSIDLTSSGFGRYGNQFSPMFIDGNYIDSTANPFLGNARDYQSIYVLFGKRGEVSRILTGQLNGANQVVLSEHPATGDLYFLVGERGSVKTLPGEQLEDQDSDALSDGSNDGTTPLLSSESTWITIKANTGEVIASSWIDPTADANNLIPPAATVPTNAFTQTRIQSVIGRVRSGAVASQETQ